jgi:hypothetical protein
MPPLAALSDRRTGLIGPWVTDEWLGRVGDPCDFFLFARIRAGPVEHIDEDHAAVVASSQEYRDEYRAVLPKLSANSIWLYLHS